MIVRYLFFWLILAIVAIANGVVRQITYGKVVPELAAHQISTIVAILATGAVVWGLSRIWPLDSSGQAWTIGIMWLLLTVVFEFGFGHFVVGHSWARLLADFDLPNGRVWLLFLMWVAVMPVLFYTWAERSA